MAGSGPLTMTVTGGAFSPTSVVVFDGVFLPTTFIDSARVSADITPVRLTKKRQFMPLPAEKAAPLRGVKGAKPRLRQAKIPRRPETVETVRLNEEYLTKRNKILDLKYKREAMELARDRDESIERALVIRQLTYMVINTRQRLLALPGTMRARFVEAFSREIIDGARELIHQALTELSEMPRRGIDPDWLERLEEED